MFKLIGTNNIENILDTTLQNRGVQDLEAYKNPSITDEIHYSKLKDISKGVKLLREHLHNKILIVTDRDLDGLTSSALIHNYLVKNTHAEVHNIQHPSRENGLTENIMNYIRTNYTNIDLVILPDSSTSDKQQHEELNNIGIDVLVLDHHEAHEIETKSEKTVIINPQLSPEYTNKRIAGVGVVYKFLQALDEEFGLSSADDNIELVAVGNISDSMDIREKDTRSLVHRGLEKIENNNFFKHMIKEYLPQKEVISAHTLSWKVFPKINALIRVGSVEELQFVYEGIRGVKGKYKNSRSKNKKIETHEEKAVRLCNNAYSRQRRYRQQLESEIKSFVEKNGLNISPIVFAPMPSSFEHKGLAGYVAGQLTNYYSKPVIVTKYNKEEQSYRGSLRGIDKLLKTTKSFLEETGKVKGYGHENACGIEFKRKDLPEIVKYTIDNLHFESNIEVDFIIEAEEMTSELIQELEELKVFWGKNVEPPKFLVKNIELDMSKFYVSDTINRGSYNNIEVATFSLPDEIRKLAKTQHKIVVDVVGVLGVNYWTNFRTGKEIEQEQIMVEEFDIKDVKKKAQRFPRNIY